MKKHLSVFLATLSLAAGLLVVGFASLPRTGGCRALSRRREWPQVRGGSVTSIRAAAASARRSACSNARNQISAHAIDLVEGHKPWTGDVSARWFAVGGDFRGGYESVDVPGSETTDEWAVSKATVYAELRLVPNLLEVYVDRRSHPMTARIARRI